MFDNICCPDCGSNDWTTVDEISDYLDNMNMTVEYLCYCDKCGCGFNFKNTYKYLKTDCANKIAM